MPLGCKKLKATVSKKECFKCRKTLPLTEFYKHKHMRDGHVNKCKRCNKIDVKANREKNIDYYREYDRGRGYRQTPEYNKEYRQKFPTKYRAVSLVSKAVRDKKLFKEPCETCGSEDRVHAHHDDYAKPLNVRWLCAAHHSQWHLENGEGKNGD